MSANTSKFIVKIVSIVAVLFLLTGCLPKAPAPTAEEWQKIIADSGGAGPVLACDQLDKLPRCGCVNPGSRGAYESQGWCIVETSAQEVASK